MQSMQPQDVLEDMIIREAVKCVRLSGWVVLPAQCYVQSVASQEMLRTGRVRAWHVFMSAHPFYNPSLQKPMPLGCGVELLGDRICAVGLQEPADRTPYLR